MNILRRYIQQLLLITLTTTFGVAWAGSPIDDAQSVAWIKHNSTQLTRLFPDANAVNTLVRQIYGDVDVKPTVGEYVFTDINGDGQLALIATVDFSGRDFYTTIFVVRQDGVQLRTVELQTGGANVTNVKSRLVDLNGDGKTELLVPRLLAPYAGSQPTPVITDVYRWNGATFEQANAQFKNYFKNTVLPRLQNALNAIQTGPGSADAANTELLKKKYLIEIAAVNSILFQ